VQQKLALAEQEAERARKRLPVVGKREGGRGTGRRPNGEWGEENGIAEGEGEGGTEEEYVESGGVGGVDGVGVRMQTGSLGV